MKTSSPIWQHNILHYPPIHQPGVGPRSTFIRDRTTAMIKEKDAGVEAVAVEAMGLDATPNANTPTTTGPALLQTLLPKLTH